MKYLVVAESKMGEEVRISEVGKSEVEKTVKEFKDNGEKIIFVKWFRKSDGQKGFLNSNGNHEITGKNWVD